MLNCHNNSFMGHPLYSSKKSSNMAKKGNVIKVWMPTVAAFVIGWFGQKWFANWYANNQANSNAGQ